MISNILRITSVVVMSLFLDTEKTLVFYHDFSGYLVFIIAVFLLMGLSRIVDRTLDFSKRKLKAAK